MKYFPNILTLFRALAGIPIALCIAVYPWLALALFVVAAITDFFDGWLARKCKVVSKFGAALDPVADKILIMAVFLGLAHSGKLYMWETILMIVMLSRELWVAGLRQLARGKDLAVITLAKYKTTLQLIAIAALLVPVAEVRIAGSMLLIAAAFITVQTGYIYTKRAFAD